MEKLHQHEIESFLFIAVKQTFKTCVAFILRLSALERGALFLRKLAFCDTFNFKNTLINLILYCDHAYSMFSDKGITLTLFATDCEIFTLLQ